MRKQLRWLIDIQKLPNELEVCRSSFVVGWVATADFCQVLAKDIWVLRLQTIQSKVSHESETDTEGLSSQVFSSQSESEAESDSRSSRRSRRDDAKPKEGTPNLSDLLSICYIATLLLRIPMTVANMHGWINRGELLFYRGSREVSLPMRERLPPRYQRLLEPQELLPPEKLHKSIVRTLAMYNKEFGMVIPPINSSLVLYRWIKDLALPLEVFAACQRLAKILNVDGTFVLTFNVGTNVVLRYPETRLMALVVVATKLLFPFDHIERQTNSATDLSALSLDWNAWAEVHKAEQDTQHPQAQLTFEQAFKLDESECLEAADDTLDAYLDWYEETVASEDVRGHGREAQDADLRRTFFRMFPRRSDQWPGKQLHTRPPAETSAKNISEIQSVLLRPRVVQLTAGRKVDQVGTSYRRIRHAEDLSGPAKVFYGKAAELAGLPPEGMVRAVFLTERKLGKSEERLRKSNSAR